jgi:hypothetical protein
LQPSSAAAATGRLGGGARRAIGRLGGGRSPAPPRQQGGGLDRWGGGAAANSGRAQTGRVSPSPDFRLVVLLPAKPSSGSDDTRGVLGELIEADDDNGRLVACTLYARAGTIHDQVYVHAKIGIIDDAWLTLGSANLNEHSLFNDTEMNPSPTTPNSPRRHACACGQNTSSSRSIGHLATLPS